MDKTRVLPLLEGDKGSARLARFWDKVDQRGDCWVWTGASGASNYGYFKLAHGVTVTAHRLALTVATRRDPVGLQAAHSCHNRLCCRPSHLRWATHQENEDDKNARAQVAAQ